MPDIQHLGFTNNGERLASPDDIDLTCTVAHCPKCSWYGMFSQPKMAPDHCPECGTYLPEVALPGY